MNKPVMLLSGAMKIAIDKLSVGRTLPTKTLVKFGKNIDRKTKNYTVNDIKVSIGTGGRRKELLKECKIPGSKLAGWQMDAVITDYWRPRVEKLGKLLGVGKPIEYFPGDGDCTRSV